jgi:hypothetical protein
LTEILDEFEERLRLSAEKLAECQRSRGFVKIYNSSEYLSCNDCSELIGCSIRKEYVDAVYSSMSKGATGGFEF